MTHQPTDEQTAILTLATSSRDNLMINALAGCGKTTTLELIESAQPDRPVLYLAFNKKIADDAEKRMASTTTVRTFNSLGHRIWAKCTGKKLTISPKKISDILRGLIKELPRPEQGYIWDAFWEITSAVNTARGLGYIPSSHTFARKRICDEAALYAALDEEPNATIARMIDTVLMISISQAYAGTCDFNDQVYMPALFGNGFPEFPLVMVDEYQDLNPINHAMIRKLAKHRLIGVGDPNQNIYGFRGASANGMSEAVTTYSMQVLPLSISFRCPSAIVKHVQRHVPNFKWLKPGGHVEALTTIDANAIPDDAVFICRNNAPLYRTAISMLAHGRSVSVSGSDIGPRVVAQMRKLGPEDTNRPALLAAVDEWEAEKLSKGSKTAADTAECMRVFARQGDNLIQAIAYAEHLFAQAGKIQFTTGHKAKGLEWDTVYHLDPFLIGEGDQEENLRYVISTRSANRLFEVNSSSIRY